MIIFPNIFISLSSWEILWNRTLVVEDKLHPANSWTSSGMRDNWNAVHFMGSKMFYAHGQNLWKVAWESWGWPKCVGMLGWFKWVRVLGWLELACPTACTCLFKVRPGVLSNTLSHIWGKLNLPIFLFNVELFTLINIDSLIFLAKPCPSMPIIW